MYFTSWDRFVQSSYNLCDESTIQPRYTLKWNATKSLLVIKITNDTTCIKFKTRSTIYLNRFDSFNRQLLKRFQNRKEDSTKLHRQEGGTTPTLDDSTTTITTTTTTMKMMDEEEKDEEARVNGNINAVGSSSASAAPTPPSKKKKKGKKKTKA